MNPLRLRDVVELYEKGVRDFDSCSIIIDPDWSPTPFLSLRSSSFRHADLTGVHLPTADFYEVDFTGAILVRSNLSNCVLMNAVFADADLSEADLLDARCEEAVFCGAELNCANLTGVNFRGADLAGLRLDRATIARGTTFREANLQKANLTHLDLEESNFVDANLSGANLSSANLRKCRLTNADLSESNLEGANLYGVVADEANYTGAKLRGANLSNALLNRAIVIDADLSGCDLRIADVSGAIVRDVNLSNSDCSHCSFVDALLVRVTFSGSNLTHANFARATLHSVTFASATLVDADLRSAQIWISDFKGVELGQTKVTTGFIDQASRQNMTIESKHPSVNVEEEFQIQHGPLFKELATSDCARIKIHFATDRLRGQNGTYGAERSDKLDFGYCEITIPRDHRMGELEAPSIWRFEVAWQESQHVIFKKTERQTPAKFLSDIRHRLGNTDNGQALVFIHGYNVSFEDGARRTAQIAYDLGFDGPAILYSWASRGDPVLYTFDEATAEDTVPRLTKFLSTLLDLNELGSVHLIAHSMGNRALVRALAALPARPSGSGRPFVNHVVLTAPDIDAGVFLGICDAVMRAAVSITLYASSNDKALHLSKRFHGYPRAGEAGKRITIVDGINTIDASSLDTNLLGHSYFADHRSVLSDIFYLLRGIPPNERFGLRKSYAGKRSYWRFQPEAPGHFIARAFRAIQKRFGS
jgi:uncharacterized protein YjbI with pentapeptide repeats/esterase/lipase superfamily enzyme